MSDLATFLIRLVRQILVMPHAPRFDLHMRHFAVFESYYNRSVESVQNEPCQELEQLRVAHAPFTRVI